MLTHDLQNLGGVFTGFCLVDILELNVDIRLRFHIRYVARYGENSMLLMELFDRICDNPEATPGTALM